MYNIATAKENHKKQEKSQMKTLSKEEFEKLNVFGTGKPNTA